MHCFAGYMPPGPDDEDMALWHALHEDGDQEDLEGEGCYLLVSVGLFSFSWDYSRNTGLIEKVSPCRVRASTGHSAMRTAEDSVRGVTFSFLCNCSRNTGL
eukprot:SAG31_NODE_945_length_10834_cov_16.777084_3_plen_101_part_00